MSGPRQRVSVRFSAGARYAASLTETGTGGYAPELWTFDTGHPHGQTLAATVTLQTEALPTPDGRLLILEYVPGHGHRLDLADPAAAATLDRLTLPGRALRLVAADLPGALALAVGFDGTASTLYRVVERPLRCERLATVAGRAGAVLALDQEGQRWAVDLYGAGGARTVVVDLGTGECRDLRVPGGARVYRLLLTHPRTGTGIVASETGGRVALGLAALDDPGDVRFLAGLNAGDDLGLPLAFDPTGERVAVRRVRGARSVLMLHDLATGEGTEAPLPAGSVFPAAGWADDGLRAAYATATQPTRLLMLSADGSRAISAPDTVDGDATLQRFVTSQGSLEAVCYGDWRTAPRVVIALHGGPEAAWELRFDPTLHRMTRAGFAVVAPNQRGSSNYGTGYAGAIHGRWGDPDLDDIRHLLRTVRAGRDPAAQAPALFGVSYGAYLALLAAAADPQLWSRCAVVAPFLSGERLWAEAAPAVRAMIERLGGRVTVTDVLGPRDLWEVAERITTPLMIIHGMRDETVPVTQSRALRQRLLDSGHDPVYLEVPDSGHQPLHGPGASGPADALIDFLLQPQPVPAVASTGR